MDILAGIFAYVAGIGALFAGLAISFFVFFATPHEPLQTQTKPQSASAMLVQPSTPKRPAALEAPARQSATQSAKQGSNRSDKDAAAAGLPQSAAAARDLRRKRAASTVQARRLIQEERARRWAYQQEPNFESRFLGYAD